VVFRVKARVLLELGAELISSDAIALYELIKNAIDAGSKTTEVRVTVALQHSSYLRLHNELRDSTSIDVPEFVAKVETELEQSAPAARKKMVMTVLEPARALAQLRNLFDDAYRAANTLDVVDDGSGMSLSELKNVYLTIGTTTRLNEKRALFDRIESEKKDPARIPFGEKGIGRLAAMRLGNMLDVSTARREDHHWNALHVDWEKVRGDLDQDLEDIQVEPKRGGAKEPSSVSGTRIRLRAFTADWTEDKLKGLARTDFAKLYDPFSKGTKRDDIRLFFNDGEIIAPAFERYLLKHADALCVGTFSADSGEPVLSGHVQYSLHGREKSFRVTAEHLNSSLRQEPGRPRKKTQKWIPTDDSIIDALRTVGPFEWEFHWFNRGRLMRDHRELWTETMRAFVQAWSGGFLVYRDGYRVYPYAAPDDDWLDIDRPALGASGYKVNRAQLIGRIRVSSRLNPRLVDQTNREGFRDCPEKVALIRMMRHVLITEFRTFLEDVGDKATSIGKDELENIERRLETSQKEAVRRIRDIGRRVPEEKQAVGELLDYLREVSLAWERAKEVASTYETKLEQYLHLAGIGLMVEFIAHELTRATQHALKTIESAGDQDHSRSAAATMETLRAQLKTIEKRLRILDPVSIPGRQRRRDEDVRAIVEEVLDSHTAQFQRHEITIQCDPVKSTKFVRRVEKGQIVQIFENFIANSVYWLREKRLRVDFEPAITIDFDEVKGQITFCDNGPGIPEERGEEVFKPFFTTKPPGKGRGLGLYSGSRTRPDGLVYSRAARRARPEERADHRRRLRVTTSGSYWARSQNAVSACSQDGGGAPIVVEAIPRTEH